MANPDHFAILNRGVKAWNEWREEHANSEIPIDLRHAKLAHAFLEGADLSNTDLSNADLRRADLASANLRQAKLLRADLSEAHLSRVDLFKANLLGADLSYADLSYALLSEARLEGAYLSHADLSEARLVGTDLSGVTFDHTTAAAVDLSLTHGLEHAIHRGPSSIGIDTLVLSKGNIPENFLRGAGVPHNFVSNLKLLMGAMDPIEFYSCFISYSSLDQYFADRVYADLQAKGVRCWFAPHDLQGGRKLHEQIDEAIRLQDKLLLILSDHSMTSEWVMTEIAKARKREFREKARVLFPISLVPFDAIRDWECFDADTGKDSAREIREYFIPDFSNWKDHDSYQTAFERLLRDLRAVSTRT